MRGLEYEITPNILLRICRLFSEGVEKTWERFEQVRLQMYLNITH